MVVKKSEPTLILNGRAALCAGRDDMTDEDEDNSGDNEDAEDKIIESGDNAFSNGNQNRTKSQQQEHRFNKPDHLKEMLESGSIPDAAMIHAARKRRQRAREQGQQQTQNYSLPSKSKLTTFE